jgi:hypothetical protein
VFVHDITEHLTYEVSALDVVKHLGTPERDYPMIN